MNRHGLPALCVAGALLLSASAGAAEFEVKMLNKGSDNQPMVFEPAFLRIQPGDTVKFVSVDKGHNAETIPGMIPDGVESFKSALSQDISVTFRTAGIYGYRCTPHVGMHGGPDRGRRWQSEPRGGKAGQAATGRRQAHDGFLRSGFKEISHLR